MECVSGEIRRHSSAFVSPAYAIIDAAHAAGVLLQVRAGLTPAQPGPPEVPDMMMPQPVAGFTVERRAVGPPAAVFCRMSRSNDLDRFF